MPIMIKNTYRLALLLAPCLLLSACSGDKIQDKLGLKRTVPDEFSVVKHAPLVMPPEYLALPTPQPGIRRPQEQEIVHEARQAVFGKVSSEQSSQKDLSAETLLLQQANATQLDPDIRRTVDQETAEIGKHSEYIGQKLLGLSGLGNDNTGEEVIDPKEELERLRQNAITAKPMLQKAVGNADKVTPRQDISKDIKTPPVPRKSPVSTDKKIIKPAPKIDTVKVAPDPKEKIVVPIQKIDPLPEKPKPVPVIQEAAPSSVIIIKGTVADPIFEIVNP